MNINKLKSVKYGKGFSVPKQNLKLNNILQTADKKNTNKFEKVAKTSSNFDIVLRKKDEDKKEYIGGKLFYAKEKSYEEKNESRIKKNIVEDKLKRLVLPKNISEKKIVDSKILRAIGANVELKSTRYIHEKNIIDLVLAKNFDKNEDVNRLVKDISRKIELDNNFIKGLDTINKSESKFFDKMKLLNELTTAYVDAGSEINEVTYLDNVSELKDEIKDIKLEILDLELSSEKKTYLKTLKKYLSDIEEFYTVVKDHHSVNFEKVEKLKDAIDVVIDIHSREPELAKNFWVELNGLDI